MKTVLEKVITSWSELRNVLEELSIAGWAFRGQADASWPLESSLTRYLKSFCGPPNNWAGREHRILRIFKSRAHLLLPRIPEEGQTLEWLALMQHHGAPTRLLDFSWSPYVAAFFALEKAITNAAIWAICPGAKVKYFSESEISAILNKILGHVDAKLHGDADLPKMPLVMLGEPFMMNQRMIAQYGTFLVPCMRIDVPLEALLPSESLFKLILAKSLRNKIMENLYSMNINNAGLFPGIDGLARSLAFELEEMKRTFDPRAARRLTKR